MTRMDVHEALYTTRMMRRLGRDPDRRPVHEVSSRNRWGRDFGLTVPEPLWPNTKEDVS